MLHIVFQKIINKKWMALSLLLGNLLMIAIAAAAPMYSDAALQRTLTRSLSNFLSETNQNPGTIHLNGSFLSSGKDRTQDMQRLTECTNLFDNTIASLKLSGLQKVTHCYKSSVKAIPSMTSDDDADGLKLQLSSYSGIENHIRITSGEIYRPQMDGHTFDVIVPESTLIKQKLILGETLELTGLTDKSGKAYHMRIAGVFEPADPQDPYWLSSPTLRSDLCLMDQDLFLEQFADVNHSAGTINVEWYAVLNYADMQALRAAEYLQVMDTAQNDFDGLNTYFNANSRPTLEKYIAEAHKVNTNIWVLLLPVFLLLIAFVFMVSRQMLEMEQNEIALYKSRGAGKRQIVQIYLIQSLCIAGVSLAGGVPLGMFLCRMLGASDSFLQFVRRTALPIQIGPKVWIIAGIAAVFSVCTMVLPIFRYANMTIVSYKRQKNKTERKRRLADILYLDVVLLAVSVYGLYQYNGQKEYLAQKVMDGASPDPLLYLCSSLFMLGCCLVILRIFPLIVRLVFLAGKKIWPPSLYASFLRILRTESNQGFLMVFLILTVALGIYNASAARTINANAMNKIKYSSGADLVLQEVWSNNGADNADSLTGVSYTDSSDLIYTEPDFSKYQTLDGVESVTKVFVNNKITVSMDNGRINNAMLMGIHTKEFGETAWFKDSLLPLHYHEYLNALSRNSKAILVSSNFREQYGYQVGDVLLYYNQSGDSMRGVIYGFVDYWPTYAPIIHTRQSDGTFAQSDQFLIVAHLAQLQASWGVSPYQVWIKAKDSTQFIYDYAQTSGSKYSLFRDASAQLIDMKKDPVYQGINGILTIGFLCVLLLCTMGFLIYWILSIRSRTLQFGIFRAMGMNIREIFSMLINEQLFITGLSLGAGIFVGILTSKLFVPLIQIAYSSADQVIPMEIISQSNDYVRLFTVIGVVILLCMIILGSLISRIQISQALKLGED